jgi:hypothetical protein
MLLSVADLIAYRLLRERIVRRQGTGALRPGISSTMRLGTSCWNLNCQAMGYGLGLGYSAEASCEKQTNISAARTRPRVHRIGVKLPNCGVFSEAVARLSNSEGSHAAAPVVCRPVHRGEIERLIGKLTIADPDNVIALVVYVAIAVAVSVVVDTAARRTRQAARASAESSTPESLRVL